MVMRNNVSQNPSNAADDDNLWPDWNPIGGVGKDSRGDAADFTFEKIRENAREGAKARQEARVAAKEERDQATFAYDADSYQGPGKPSTSLSE